MNEESMLKVSTVAKRLGVSGETVRQKFAGKPGVLIISRNKIRTHIRIPLALVQDYEAKHILKSKPSRRRV